MIVLYGTEYKSSVMIMLQVPFTYSCAKPLLRLKVVQTWFGISFINLFFYNTQGISCSLRAFGENQAYKGLRIYFCMASVAGYGLDYDLTGRDRGTD